MFYFNDIQMIERAEDVTFYVFSITLLLAIVGFINATAYIVPSVNFMVK